MNQTSNKGQIVLYSSSRNFEKKLQLPQTSKNYVFTFKLKIIKSRMHRKKQLNWIIMEKVMHQTSNKGQSCA